MRSASEPSPRPLLTLDHTCTVGCDTPRMAGVKSLYDATSLTGGKSVAVERWLSVCSMRGAPLPVTGPGLYVPAPLHNTPIGNKIERKKMKKELRNTGTRTKETK